MCIDKDKLYEQIDHDDEMTDQEKRDTYFSEIENDRMEQEWRDEH